MERSVGCMINIKNEIKYKNVEENAVSVKQGRPLYVYITNAKTKKNTLKVI